MNVQSTRLASAAGLIWLGLGECYNAEAGAIQLATPAGVKVGESFRFVFITDGTTSANLLEHRPLQLLRGRAGGRCHL